MPWGQIIGSAWPRNTEEIRHPGNEKRPPPGEGNGPNIRYRPMLPNTQILREEAGGARNVDVDKKFRFYVGSDSKVRSLRFSVDRNKRDLYVTCAKIPGRKLSLHGSGKSRDALVSSAPRPAIESAHLLKLRQGQFWTVARVFFTAHSDWEADHGPVRGKSIVLQPPAPNDCACISLGFTGHHPTLDVRTAHPANRATIKLREDKYLTASQDDSSIAHAADFILKHLSPHRATSITEHEFPTEGDASKFDYLVQYRSRLNTFVYWAHHGIPKDDLKWKENHPIALAIEEAHQREIVGLSLGTRLETVVQSVGLEPDRDPGP